MSEIVPDALPDALGHYGPFGGRFVPEALMAALQELTEAFESSQDDPRFAAELADLQVNYAGRPSLLTEAPRFAARSARPATSASATAAGPASCSSARTSTTPAATRSTTCSDRAC